MDFRPRVEEISKRCAINNYMVHGTAIKDTTNKFSGLNCRHAMAWRHQ